MIRLLTALICRCGAGPGLLFATGMMAWLLAGPVMAQGASDIIARVDGQIVTTGDVENYIRLLTPEPGESAEALRHRARDLLLAGLVVRGRLISGTDGPEDSLLQKLKEAQRRVMLDHYVAQNSTRYTPTDAEIREFSRQNPQMFEGRASYRYVEVILREMTEPHKQALRGELAGLPQGPLSMAQVTDLLARLRAARLPFSALSVTRSTEQLPRTFAAALDRLWSGHQRFTLMPTAVDQRLILLIDRTPDPVRVEDMRDQIAEGLIRQNAADQRDRIIHDLAQEALKGSSVGAPGPAADRVTARQQAAPAPLSNLRPNLRIALMAALAGAACGLAASWLQAARSRFDPDDEEDSLLQNPAARLVVTLPMMAVPLVCLAFLVTYSPPLADWRQSMILTAAAGGSGLSAGPLLHRVAPRAIIMLAPLAVALIVAIQIGAVLLWP